jgi:SAM-dependent methyltransferase
MKPPENHLNSEYRLKKEFVKLEALGYTFSDGEQNEIYSNEQILYEGTPFFLIYLILEEIQIIENLVIYDLGCGYGRFVITGAAKYPNTIFKGIELVEERIIKAKYFSDKMMLTNALFIEGNVLNIDISDGDIFYMFNPFSDSALQSILEKLHKLSEIKDFKIISVGYLNEKNLKLDWLDCIYNKTFSYRGLDLYSTCIFKPSIP